MSCYEYAQRDGIDRVRSVQLWTDIGLIPNLIKNTYIKYEQPRTNDLLMMFQRQSHQTLVYLTSYTFYLDSFHEFMKQKCAGIETESKDFVLPCKPWDPKVEKKEVRPKSKPKKDVKDKKSKKKKKDKKSAKKKDTKKPKQDIVTITVPAEVFFTDPLLATYKAENNAGVIQHVFIQLSVDRLITRAQKLVLNPLVIKMKKLSNIPVNILRDIGISSIYVTYNIPYIAYCKSMEKPLVETIRFNEAHIHFNDTTSKIKLIEFIQTRKLFMQIYGKRNSLSLNRPAVLFGNEIDDDSIAKLIPVHYHEEEYSDNEAELLAVCAYDISSLIDNIWDFKEKGQCHEPGLTLFQKSLGRYDIFSYVGTETVNEININPAYFKTRGPIPEERLLTFGTTLQVEVYLLAPQAPSLIVNHFQRIFKRLLVIIHCAEFSKDVYNEIRKHNEEMYLLEMKKILPDMELSDTLTGFMVDNGNHFIFFVEGLAAGAILNIWHAIHNSAWRIVKIFFNTEVAFENRLYSSFLNEGIFSITLRIPLQDILSEQRLYWKGNVPLPCMEMIWREGIMSASNREILGGVSFQGAPKPQFSL